MSNSCYSRLTFKHKTEQEAKRMFELLGVWQKKAVQGDYVDDWLGNICLNSGIGFYTNGFMKDERGEDLFCRGTVCDCEREGVFVYISQDTAWTPAMRMWRLLCEKHNFDCEIEFYAEEGGNGIFVTNDPDLEGDYNIDVFNDPPEWFAEAESVWDSCLESTIEFLQKALKTDESDIKKLMEMQFKSDDCDWFVVHEWEHSDIDEWN